MKTTKSDGVELLCCTALTCVLFQELELVQDGNFFFPCQTCPFRWSHLERMKHNHLCLQTGVAVAARENVFQAATPAIRAIYAALSAQMFPLAPLKVADITGGLDDISGGFCDVKFRFRPKMTNISGWMIYPVDLTGFYYIEKMKRILFFSKRAGATLARTGTSPSGVALASATGHVVLGTAGKVVAPTATVSSTPVPAPSQFHNFALFSFLSFLPIRSITETQTTIRLPDFTDYRLSISSLWQIERKRVSATAKPTQQNPMNS